MITFHQQNPWLTYRKINRESHWFSATWRLLVHELNALGPQHAQAFRMQVWHRQIIEARTASAFGLTLNHNQSKILNLIFEHHPCPEYLKDEHSTDDRSDSLASTIPQLEEPEDLELELVLDEEV